ncbi:hypothetical protein SDC9_54084 [bioreactor metagenome]|uniref:Uncharacterized protein n=1 Tax=bioreactor metagenome TaxID=1076179 RepID=A0A644WV41_9ZZZZ
MRDGNTMSKTGYILEHAFWGLLASVIYEYACFRCALGMGFAASRLLLWGLMASFSALGIALTWGRRRNHLSMFVNLVLPAQLYTTLSYWPDMKRPFMAVGAAAGIAAFAYFLTVMCRKIENRGRCGAVLMRRLRHGVLGGRTLFAICLTLLFVPIGLKLALGYDLFYPAVAPAASAAENHTIAGHLEELQRLEEDTWETLDSTERLDLLQTVANIEDTYLGLPHELNVTAGDLPQSIVGQYDDRTHTITLDADYLETRLAHEVLDTVCHEAYHAYQHRLCDAYDSLDNDFKGLLLFYRTEKYTVDFENYNSGYDFDAYYSQQVEIDARNYAADAVEDYYAKIKAD